MPVFFLLERRGHQKKKRKRVKFQEALGGGKSVVIN